MRDPKERLRDILQAIEAIDRYRACERGEFDRHLQIIGEAARHVPDEVRGMAPDIPWNKIIGMRNILVQGYFTIDLDIVWDAVEQDVPLLKPAVVALLKQLETQA